MTIQRLLKEKVLRRASLPMGNWQIISVAQSLSVPLIAEDYPAKTPAMWNSAYEHFGMRDRNFMVVADPKDAAKIMKTFRNDPKYRGGGAGIGWKEIVIPYLDEVTPMAKAMGAVNIVKKTDPAYLIGDNTDGVGFAQSLADMFPKGYKLRDKEVLLLGAGGSGRAIAFALADFGTRVNIVNRTEEKAVSLAKDVKAYFNGVKVKGFGRNEIASLIPSADAVVSVVDDVASPFDQYSTIGAMDFPVSPRTVERNQMNSEQILKTAKRSLIVSDIRIRREKTPMLVQAEKLGFKILDGIPMVINQGVQAFHFLYDEELGEKDIKPREVYRIMKEAIQ